MVLVENFVYFVNYHVNQYIWMSKSLVDRGIVSTQMTYLLLTKWFNLFQTITMSLSNIFYYGQHLDDKILQINLYLLFQPLSNVIRNRRLNLWTNSGVFIFSWDDCQLSNLPLTSLIWIGIHENLATLIDIGYSI